ncbi:MAG: DUF1549 domain-containing protein, partial [Planctomycetales bacterium]
MRHSFLVILALLCCVSTTGADEPPFSADDFEYFERKIRPLLSRRCFSCHSSQAKTVHGGLRLDTFSALWQGGDSGPALVAGHRENSLLLKVIRYDGDVQMPPKGKLPAAEIAELTSWVKRGAPIPPASDSPARPNEKIDFEKGRNFWSFQPVTEQPVPKVTRPGWAHARIDAFVLAALERQGLTPAPEADRAVLIRRATFDLIGLPPTPEQVRAFLDDESPRAYEKLIDRLLKSPRYGEKWARLWLDLARYTDKTATAQKAAKIERSVAREREGILDVSFEFSDRPVEKHIHDWVADLRRAGRSKDYICKAQGRVERLRRELGWTKLSSIRPMRLTEWLA